MRIHKEGYSIILLVVIVSLIVILFSWLVFPTFVAWLFTIAGVGLSLFVMSFFRSPDREVLKDPSAVFAAADGKVVVIEEVEEKKYFHDKRIQVSIFMSIWNVHVNWFPIGGIVKFFKHHNGKFLVAWHPKSSEDNERTTIVVDTGKTEILIRQIAGLVARRIVSYAEVGSHVEQNWQCGFIKFGSRVDVFLPLDATINVQLGEKVVGSQTVIAYLPGEDNEKK